MAKTQRLQRGVAATTTYLARPSLAPMSVLSIADCNSARLMPNTQLVFIGYLAVAAVSMLIMHVLAERVANGREWPRWRALLPFATQFALGGLWSAFLVFYSRSAVLTASWPFLMVLVAIFLGNEIFKHYHSRLAFAAVLFFFALVSYCIVTVPLFTHSVGMLNFLLAGGIALGIFFMLMRV